jgi:hypothetical protein
VTTLTRFRPHAPTADPFADTWYYYVNDPELGYLKLVLVTYLSSQTNGHDQHAYVHVAVAPLDGPTREYDHYFDDVVIATPDGDDPWSFSVDVPGAVHVDARSVELTLPDVSVSARFDGAHEHYWPGPDEAASPFTGPTDGEPGRSHWFVFTLGTPTECRFEDGHGAHAGRGLAYVERGWSVRQAHGFCYLMAVSRMAKLMLTCGMPNDDVAVWAGRLVTADHDIRFLPFAGEQQVTSNLEPSRGAASLEIEQAGYVVRVVSGAPLRDFYDQVTPSLTVFGADTPVAKTMNARLHVEILRDGAVLETVDLPQSILEFGGVLYPPELATINQATRPEYRYER